MAIFIERKDYELLLVVAKFCGKIDSYSSLFNLDEHEIDELKNDSLLFAYVFSNSGNYSSFTESFTKCKIQNIRVRLSNISQACKNHSHYTVAIGMDLGIEIPVYAFHPN
jgi:hypothetical protein